MLLAAIIVDNDEPENYGSSSRIFDGGCCFLGSN
jgi:hypothetical protein